MPTYYKLTTEDDTTYGYTQWGPGVTHAAGGLGRFLCSDGYIHAYEHPLLAVLHDPIHGGFGPEAHLWECESDDVPLRDGQMKLGVKTLTVVRQIPLPAVTFTQRVRYAILCAKAVYSEPSWLAWASEWFNGVRVANAAAYAAADAAYAAGHAANAAAYAAARAAGDAAYAAADAAYAAGHAANAAAYAAGHAVAHGAYAAHAAAHAVAHAAYAANAAAHAAGYAAAQAVAHAAHAANAAAPRLLPDLVVLAEASLHD